jgi:hypothetical protein
MNAIDLNRRAISATVATSLLGVATASCANMAIDELPYAKSAPFTAQEFWEKFLDLINEKGGPPGRDRVERAIGTKFIRLETYSQSTEFFLDYGKHWYFNARFSIAKSHHYLSISAVDTVGLTFRQQPIVWNPDVSKKLLENGWKFYLRSPHVGPTNRSYKTDHADLSLTVFENRLIGLSVVWKT